MNIREMREAWEADYLSCYASLSKNTRGRDREEQPVTSALHISATVTGFSIANPSEDSNIRPRYFWLRRVTITVPV